MRSNRIILLSVTLFALCSCTSIPSSSPIHKLPSAQSTTDTQFVRVIARPPAKDAKPAAIVRGFLDACADTSGDYSIAREYLDSRTSSAWRPDAKITTYDSSTLAITKSGSDYQISGTVTGLVDSYHHYSAVISPKPLDYRVALGQDAQNQWRITNIPQGVIAPLADVQRRLRGYSVFFFNKEGLTLVPDSVVLPRGSSGVATSLIQALLSGPRIDFVDSLSSAFPDGTRLSYGSIPIAKGIATVDLTMSSRSLTINRYERIVAQIVWTLSQLDSIHHVQILFSGKPYSNDSFPNQVSVDDVSKYAPTYLTQKSNLIFSVGKSAYSISANGAKQYLYPLPVDTSAMTAHFSVSSFTGHVAVVGDSGKNLFVRRDVNQGFRQVFAGESLSAPSWSRSGQVFVADYGHWIASIGIDNEINFLRLSTSTLGTATDVSHFAVAPDGSRVAIIFGTGDSVTLATGILIPDGRHMRVASITPVASGLSGVKNILWVDESHIAILRVSQLITSEVKVISTSDGSVENIKISYPARSFAFSASGQLAVSVVRQGEQQILERKQGAWVRQGVGDIPAFAP